MGSGGGSEEDSVSGEGATSEDPGFLRGQPVPASAATSRAPRNPCPCPNRPAPAAAVPQAQAAPFVRSLLAGSGAGVVIDGSWVLSRHAAVQLWATNCRFWRPLQRMPCPPPSLQRYPRCTTRCRLFIWTCVTDGRSLRTLAWPSALRTWLGCTVVHRTAAPMASWGRPVSWTPPTVPWAGLLTTSCAHARAGRLGGLGRGRVRRDSHQAWRLVRECDPSPCRTPTFAPFRRGGCLACWCPQAQAPCTHAIPLRLLKMLLRVRLAPVFVSLPTVALWGR